MLRLLTATALCLSCVGVQAAPVGPTDTGDATPNTSSVTADLASRSYTIPKDFVGYSQEEADVVYEGIYNSANRSLINLLKMLGPNGELRIGGNSQDTPNAYTSTIPPVTQAIADDVAAFASAIGPGWTVDWGLDGKANNTSAAVTHAGYFISAFSRIPNALIFSFDNEPDLWKGYTGSSFQTVWNSYYSALTSAYPSIKYEGIEITCGNPSYSDHLAPGLSALQFYSCHKYFTGDPTPDAASVIAKAQAYDLATNIGSVPVPFRDNETGINYDVGSPRGVVDRLAASSWYLNLAINIAIEGGAGLNPHSVLSTSGAIASNFAGNALSTWNAFDKAVDGNYYPNPIFYGMFLMSRMVGQQVVATSKTGTGNVAALATKGANGNANILVANNDTSLPVVITPGQSNAWTSANVMVLQAGSGEGCGDQHPTVGGSTIGESGAWAGGFSRIPNGSTVTIGPCGAALIEILP